MFSRPETAPASPVIEIFKAGTHKAGNGDTYTLTATDLQQIARDYDPQLSDAPVVVGHPKHNGPAYGWVKCLRVEGVVLKAELDKVDPDFAEIVKAGRFRRVSASFYNPDSPHNPRPGRMYLRHVGFLGALPPAVKGLKAVEFASDDEGVLVFGDDGDDWGTSDFAERERQLAERERQVAEREAVTRRKDNRTFLHGLVKSGRPLPMQEEKMLDFMEEMEAAGGTLDFGEGDERSLVDVFKEQFLSRLPVQVQFGEFSGGGELEFSEDDDTDIRAREIDEFVQKQRAEGRNISYADAALMTKKKR